MSGCDNNDFHAVDGTCRKTVAVDVRTGSESLPRIFKMNVDGFEELFEWVSVKDLYALRQTCKRMKRVVDYYIKINYPRTLQTLYIESNTKLEQFCGADIKTFELVNQIEFHQPNPFTLDEIDTFKPILAQAEVVSVNSSSANIELFDIFLNHCTRFKNLFICGGNVSIFMENGRKWLHQCYPTLEHIGIDEYDDLCLEYTDLKIFLQQNPNIKQLSVSMNLIWLNRKWIRESRIRIDILRVEYYSPSKVSFDRLCELLNELQDIGFFQRLHIALSHYTTIEYSRSNTPLRALEALFGYNRSKIDLLPFLSNLEELEMYVNDDDNLETIATHLPNLYRISIRRASFVRILPFFHRCPKLIEIRIVVLENDEVFFGEDVIDLLALNKERKKLRNARKIMIFINERIFLLNKWKQNINLNLIKLNRKQSWKESFPSI